MSHATLLQENWNQESQEPGIHRSVIHESILVDPNRVPGRGEGSDVVAA